MRYVEPVKDEYAYEPPTVADTSVLTVKSAEMYLVLVELCQKARRIEKFGVGYQIHLSHDQMNDIKKLLSDARQDDEPYGVDVDVDAVARIAEWRAEWDD